MSGFSSDWLTLREPLDAAARCVDLRQRALDALCSQNLTADEIAIIDLGAGTGANLRYTARFINRPQRWLLVEHDGRLLKEARDKLHSWRAPAHCEVELLELDLAGQPEQLPWKSVMLLSASALLDLVSEVWLRALLQRAAATRAVVWFTLTYDGRISCYPPEPEDREVRELINRHQLTDKGFGPALGPGAAHAALQALKAQGYQVHSATSDWHIAPHHTTMQQLLVEGWYQAASEIAPLRAPALQDWLKRRCSHIAAARSELRVGHIDIVGHP